MLATIDSFNTALNQWFASLGPTVDDMARLILAAIVGGLVGLEREIRGRQAGFRTHLLVCVGSALVMIVSIEVVARPWTSHITGGSIQADPARIAYGVMTGVGFLGAGAIISQGGVVRGLTTAAALWCVAAIGLSVGLGMYIVSVFASVLVLCVLYFLDHFERWIPRTEHRKLTLRTEYSAECIHEATRLIESAGIKAENTDFKRLPENIGRVDVEVMIAYRSKDQYRALERMIEANADYELIGSRAS